MPSYVVLGASRGIGLALVKRLAADKNNTVVALVRSVEATKATLAADVPGADIHVVHADLDDRKSLEIVLTRTYAQTAATEVAALTDGAVDVFVANGAISTAGYQLLPEEATSSPEQFEKDMLACFQTNVIGTVQAVAYFGPLVARSRLKKIAVVSSAVGDVGFTLQAGFDITTPYTISKAAVNMAVAKFHLAYRDQGVTVFAVSPGLVATELGSNPNTPPTPEEAAVRDAAMARIVGMLRAYQPDWEPRAMTPDESASAVVDVLAGATLEKNGGLMVSHHGNQTDWL